MKTRFPLREKCWTEQPFERHAKGGQEWTPPPTSIHCSAQRSHNKHFGNPHN